MDPDFAKLAGAGSVAGALLFLIYLVGNRLVAAIDKLVTAITEHTKTDLEHHADVKESVIRLESKVDTVLGIAPIDEPPPPRRTPMRGIAIGRPSTQDK